MNELRLAIIGVGLIGGSLGLALKDKLQDKIYISGLCRTEASMQAALERGAVDFVSNNLAEVVKDADVVFLSTPVLQMVPMVEKLLPYLKPGTILTDAGSTKQYIWQRLKKLLPDGVFYVAGHPMTGKEKSGVAAADKNLFVNKSYVIVDDTGAPPEVRKKIVSLLSLTGANITTLDIAKHDRCASVISHVPHVTAAALVNLMLRNEKDMSSCLKLAGGGFKDTTRIASSNSDMWADICMTNPEAMVAHIDELKCILTDVSDAIKRQDRQAVYDYFASAKKCRDGILDRSEKMFEI